MNLEPDPLKRYFSLLELSLPLLPADVVEEIANKYRKDLLKIRRRKRLLKYRCEIHVTHETLANLKKSSETENGVEELLNFFNTYFTGEDDDMANLSLEKWKSLTWTLTVSTEPWKAHHCISLHSAADIHRRTHKIAIDFDFNFNIKSRMRIKYSGPQRWKQSTFVHLETKVQDVEDPFGALTHI